MSVTKLHEKIALLYEDQNTHCNIEKPDNTPREQASIIVALTSISDHQQNLIN